jgi:4-aminobutyrate aminotransferase
MRRCLDGASAARRALPRAARRASSALAALYPGSSLNRPDYAPARALELLRDHFAPAVARAPKGNDIVCASAQGAWVTDVAGRRFLDLQTGIGVQSTGHAHPRVVAAVAAQMAKGAHLQQNCMISQPVLRLLEALHEATPKGLSRFFFNCTGSEAIESAVKLARHETGRQNVVVFNGGFHGRSLTALAMTTSKYAYRVGYGPLPSGVHVAKFPYCLHCPAAPAGGGCCGDALEGLETLLREQSAPADTACIVIEPVLGEGGYVAPPAGFLRALRALCDRHGILLVLDEVQSGVGRTGKMWAFEHEGEDFLPDILVFAKGIASGVPLSGIATRPGMMLKSPSGSMGGTYGATAVAAAAAVATLETIRDERLLENAARRGAQLAAGLRALQAEFPQHVRDVRGRGCMVGLEFAAPVGSGRAGAVTAEAMREGLLLLTTGWRETIRFIPPLVISEAEVALALEKFGAALRRVLSKL